MEMVVIDIQKLNKALALATSSTKNLVKSGLNGDKTKFPELLAKYKWPGTRDFNLALIIIALYVYCLKSSNKELQKIGMKARMTSKNSPFEALEGGDGVTVAKNLTKHFGDKKIQKLILNLKDVKPDPNDKFNISENINFYNDNTCEKVFDNGLFERAKKIKPWKINENEVVRCIHLLTDPVQKQHTDNLKEEKKKLAEGKKELNKEIKKSNKKSKKIAKLKKELNTSKSTIEKQKNELENLEKARNDSENKIKEHENVIFELKEKLKSKDDEMHSNISKLENTINELKSLYAAKETDIAGLKSRLNNATREFKKLNSTKFKNNIDKNRAEKLKQIYEELQIISTIEHLEKIWSSYDLREINLTTLQKIIDLYTNKDNCMSILYGKALPIPKETPEKNIEKYLKELKTFANSITNYIKDYKPILAYQKNFEEINEKISDAISNIKFYITAEKSAKFGNYNYRDILCAEEDMQFLKNAPKNTIESSPFYSHYYCKTNNKDDALDYLKKHGGVLID